MRAELSLAPGGAECFAGLGFATSQGQALLLGLQRQCCIEENSSGHTLVAQHPREGAGPPPRSQTAKVASDPASLGKAASSEGHGVDRRCFPFDPPQAQSSASSRGSSGAPVQHRDRPAGPLSRCSCPPARDPSAPPPAGWAHAGPGPLPVAATQGGTRGFVGLVFSGLERVDKSPLCEPLFWAERARPFPSLLAALPCPRSAPGPPLQPAQPPRVALLQGPQAF